MSSSRFDERGKSLYKEAKPDSPTCPKCKGTGVVKALAGPALEDHECPSCEGHGRTIK